MWLFWLLILVAIALAVKYFMNNAARNQSETPMEILQKRYARGEIDEDEFVRRRNELSK
ncbi:MAG TPA: SHOCT domain-containing protein [Gammaproteobacteria bacterium]|nr:SHOCT domain-containing protein [Gammaproteobacteria bacterium]